MRPCFILRRVLLQILTAASDAYKMSNSIFNLSTLTESGVYLAINGMPSFDCNHTIKLTVWNAPAGTYKLDFSQYESFNEAVSIIVKDNFTKTEVDVRTNTFL